VGNFYATNYRDALGRAVKTAAALPALEPARWPSSTLLRNDFHGYKRGALNNLTAVRSQTSFRTADGCFYGWEGCFDTKGCCGGSCTHAWKLRPSHAVSGRRSARTMRETEFLRETEEDGSMWFRANLPPGVHGCAPGRFPRPMARWAACETLSRWRLSGDGAMMRALWPQARSL